jgi:broad specificity phosphatase PhoE
LTPGTSGGEVVLVRHGPTEWSQSGRHTGRTDVPLTDAGRAEATALGRRLARRRFALVLTSPLRRAADTCRLALGPDQPVEVDDDLVEWDYGEYEGRRTDEIRAERPGWLLWTDGCPGGETAAQVGERADRVVARLRGAPAGGDAAVFAHGHLLRVLAARWLGLPAVGGRLLALDPVTLSVLGWEREVAVVRLWNAGAHD